MREGNFIFDSVQLIYYKCHKVNFRRGGSCIGKIYEKALYFFERTRKKYN